MSCQRVNYVPSKCHRVLSEPHPIKPRHTRVYIPASLWPLRPPHVMNIFTLIGRLGIFHLARRCVGVEVCPSLRYFIYIDGTCLSFWERSSRARAPLHAVFIGNSRMSDESSPTLMILSSLSENPWSLR